MQGYWLFAYFLFAVGIGALYYFLRSYIKSTVEESVGHTFDIKLENFKQNFVRELHTLDRKDKYQLAALDERLRAHQKAFHLSRKMVRALHRTDKERDAIVKECDDFWNSYSLYLNNNSKEAFWKAFISFADYPMYKLNHRYAIDDKDRSAINEAKNMLTTAFREVTDLGIILQQDVDIEAIVMQDLKINGKEVTAFGVEKK